MFGNQKINVRPRDADKVEWFTADHETAGSDDLCFLTASTPDQVVAHLKANGVAIEEGPVAKQGARGTLRSVYCRDPDGSLIEISSYEGETSLLPAIARSKAPTLGESPAGGCPLHDLFQIVKTALGKPIRSRRPSVLVAGRITFALGVRTIKLRELRLTAGAVIVIPAFAPAGVLAEMESQTFEAMGVVDTPFIF